MLCREQSWTYEYHGGGGKPKLYNPDGDWMTLPLTPSSYGSVLSSKAHMKRLGADLDRSVPRRSSFNGESLFSDETPSHLTDAEWRELQGQAGGWRAQLVGYVEPEPEPEPEPLSRQAQDLLARATRGRVIRDDAKGDTWTLAAARQLLRDGYSLDRVVERTGWGSMWLADLAARLDAS